MKIINGIIYGDEHIIETAEQSGVSLDTVDVSQYRPDADILARLFDEADRTKKVGKEESALLYAALKRKYLEHVER